jgi:hypothetical protein
MSLTQQPGWIRFQPIGQEAVPQPTLYVEGTITTLSQTLVTSIRQFCATNNTNDLPVSRSRWTNQKLDQTRWGRGKTWKLIATDEEINMGRFRYGKERQLLVAQGKPGSDWEDGNMVLIGGKVGRDLYKIWRFQRDWNQDPDEDLAVECVFDPEDDNQPPPQIDFSDPIFTQPHGSPSAGVPPASANQTDANPLRAPRSSSVESQTRQSEVLKREVEDDDAGTGAPERRRGEPSSRTMRRDDNEDDDSEYSPVEKTPKPRKKISNTRLFALTSAPRTEGYKSPAIKQEAQPTQSNTTYDLLKVKVIFLSSTGAIVRKRFLDHCIPLDQLFLQAYAANIIEEHGSKLTAYIGNDEYTLVKNLPSDYDDLLAELETARATEIGIRRGMDVVL